MPKVAGIAHHKEEKPAGTEAEGNPRIHKLAISLGKKKMKDKPQRHVDREVQASKVEVKEWRTIAEAWSRGSDRDGELGRGQSQSSEYEHPDDEGKYAQRHSPNMRTDRVTIKTNTG